MTSEEKAPTCDGSAQFSTVWQRQSMAAPGVAKAQYGPEQRRRGEAWQSGGREKQSIARNRHGVDLRSKDGHRQRTEAQSNEEAMNCGTLQRQSIARTCLASAKRGKGQRRRCGDLIGTAKKNKQL